MENRKELLEQYMEDGKLSSEKVSCLHGSLYLVGS